MGGGGGGGGGGAGGPQSPTKMAHSPRPTIRIFLLQIMPASSRFQGLQYIFYQSGVV
jgi:hypothetical protein